MYFTQTGGESARTPKSMTASQLSQRMMWWVNSKRQRWITSTCVWGHDTLFQSNVWSFYLTKMEFMKYSSMLGQAVNKNTPQFIFPIRFWFCVHFFSAYHWILWIMRMFHWSMLKVKARLLKWFHIKVDPLVNSQGCSQGSFLWGVWMFPPTV